MRLTDLRGRSVAVWGTDAEGRAAATAIAGHGPSRLLAVDDSAAYPSIPWENEAAPLAGGDHAFPALAAAEVVVRSPAVPSTHPWMIELLGRGITVTSGNALWMTDHAAQSIVVTRSDDKDPTAALLGRLLNALGHPTVLGGDTPLLALPAPALPPPPLSGSPSSAPALSGSALSGSALSGTSQIGRYVLELSVAQCADMTVAPRVAVLTAGSSPRLDLLRHGPDLIVADGTDLPLRDELRGRTDLNGFPPVPAGAADSRFRVEDGAFHCSDEALFPRTTLRLDGDQHGRALCLGLAVLDGLGFDVPGSASVLRAALASFTY